MKRVISTALAIALIVAALALPAAAVGGQGGEYGIVKEDGVRLRTSMDASTTGNVLGLLFEGERLNITQAYPSWAYGQMADGYNAGKWGYVAVEYLTIYQQ